MPSSLELLQNSLNEWAALHRAHKPLEQAEIDAWVRIFVHTDSRVLAVALDLVTTNAERMPAPGHLTKAIAAAKEHLNVKGTPALTYREGTDRQGTTCVFWSDEPNTPAYRAKDCPEGRVFVALMEDWSLRQKEQYPPGEAELANRRELLRQGEESWRKKSGSA